MDGGRWALLHGADQPRDDRLLVQIMLPLAIAIQAYAVEV